MLKSWGPGIAAARSIYSSTSPVAAAAAAGGAPAASSGRVALVKGSSRGLGLEFVRQLLQRPDTSVVATCRTPPAAAQLLELQQQHGARLAVLQLDSTDEASIARAAEEVRWDGPLCSCAPLHSHTGAQRRFPLFRCLMAAPCHLLPAPAA
jgi:hypothetical protein